jgi:hypothetical protein
MKEDTIPDILPPELSALFAQFDRENSRRSRGGRPRPMQPDEPAADVKSNPHPASKETNAKDRQSNGRFAKGNRGGPGNPFARQVAAFRACLINSVTEEDMEVIADKLVDWARDGNLQAIKLLFSYLLGTPKPVVEPDELDLHEMHLAHQTTLAAQALQQAEKANSPANDAPTPLDSEVGIPTQSVVEAPSAPASAPSAIGINGDPCPPTASQTPSPNGELKAGEACNRPQPPSTNRLNSAPAASGSQTTPSTKRSNGKGQPGAGGSAPPRSHVADEKQT